MRRIVRKLVFRSDLCMSHFIKFSVTSAAKVYVTTRSQCIETTRCSKEHNGVVPIGKASRHSRWLLHLLPIDERGRSPAIVEKFIGVTVPKLDIPRRNSSTLWWLSRCARHRESPPKRWIFFPFFLFPFPPLLSEFLFQTT